MATKISKARRIGGIVVGVVRTIFRGGRTWGTTRTKVRTVRRPAPTVGAKAGLVAGAAAGATGTYFLMRRGTDPYDPPHAAA
jgi:hypothetical protein